MQSIKLPAFAKINWSLRVLGKRADGYHEIETILQTISLHDTITVERIPDQDIRLWGDEKSVPADQDNLVWRAAAAVRERYSIRDGVKIRLEKRIPSEAGLGGGSSDAAVTLIALVRLWRIETSPDELVQIAESLGSDVPFFFHGGTAHGTGCGNVIEPLNDAPERQLLVIKPKASISTAHAYNALNLPALTSSDAKPILSRSQAREYSESFDLIEFGNDFEPVVFKQEPEIERAKNVLLNSEARATLLAGSGAAVFGVFDNQDAQERAIQAVELEAGWRAFPCKTVGRSQYRKMLGNFGELLLYDDTSRLR